MRKKLPTVHFPDSNQVQQTFPHPHSCHSHSLSSQPTTSVIMPKHHHSKPPSSTNVDAFPLEGWMTKDHPIECVVSVRIGEVIGYEDYYFENGWVLCSGALSTSTAATTIDNSVTPPVSTELDNGTDHNCKMPKALYKAFCHHVLSLPPNFWALSSYRTLMPWCIIMIPTDTM